MSSLRTTGARLAGKVAIVTGGGSGYGAGIARRFAQEGAKVVVADINEEGAHATAQLLPNSMSFLKVNITKKSDWQRLLDVTEQRYGRIDCLVNNAGTTYKNKPTLQVTEEEFARCFDVNVKSIFHSTALLVPRLIQQGSGVVLNVASVGATRPRPGLVWYNASKGAVWNVSPPTCTVFKR